MSTTPKITLYAPGSTLPYSEPVSPFSRIVVYALGYRGIEYTYHPVPLCDVQSFAPTIGAKPTTTWPDGSPKYTLPVIVDSTDPSAPVAIADSMAILKYLEKIYPDPSRPLFSATAAMELLTAGSIGAIMVPLFDSILLEGSLSLLTAADKVHYTNRVLGGQAPELLFVHKGSEKYISLVTKAKGEYIRLAGVLSAQSGMWFGGDKPVYVDFLLLASLSVLRRMGGDLWEEAFSKLDEGRFLRMYETGENQFSKF